jgi:nickel transport protein
MMRIIALAAFLGLLAAPAPVLAHGTDYRVIADNDPVVGIAFFYSDKVPMRYAEVLVYSPENDKIEFQNGRTDAEGRFAFFAETPGDWRVEVNDGMGHAVHATVAVTPREAETADSAEVAAMQKKLSATEKKHALLGDASTGVKMFLGLSILMNLFFGMYVWKRKSAATAE